MDAPGHSTVEYDKVGKEYFENRQLKRGAAGWLLLVGLGVAYVISGDYAGWNFGLAQGGWGGLFVASLLMATMYTCMCFALAELATIAPTAGGGYGFARRAFGPWGGFLCGVAILMEYAIAPAAIAVFIGAYCSSLFGIDGWIVYLGFYAIFLGIHLYGAGEALRLIFAITLLAVIALVVFVVAMVPYFDSNNLFDIPVTDAAGASPFLPFGYIGIWAAIPYAIWFFLAVEGVPLAAEETTDPKRDLPRGLIGGIIVLVAFCALILVFGPGGAGADALKSSGNPLVAAFPGGAGADALKSSGNPLVAALEITKGFRRTKLGQPLRKFCGPRGARRELLLNHLWLFAARVCDVPCRIPATCPVADQLSKEPLCRSNRPWHHRISVVAQRTGRPPDPGRSVWRHNLVRDDDGFAHRIAYP